MNPSIQDLAQKAAERIPTWPSVCLGPAEVLTLLSSKNDKEHAEAMSLKDSEIERLRSQNGIYTARISSIRETVERKNAEISDLKRIIGEQGKIPLPAAQYRRLEVGERIQEGDEWWVRTEKWEPVIRHAIGETAGKHVKFRRPITPPVATEPLPCPFCGSTTVILDKGDARCRHCHLGWIPLHIWNTRTPLQPVPNKDGERLAWLQEYSMGYPIQLSRKADFSDEKRSGPDWCVVTIGVGSGPFERSYQGTASLRTAIDAAMLSTQNEKGGEAKCAPQPEMVADAPVAPTPKASDSTCPTVPSTGASNGPSGVPPSSGPTPETDAKAQEQCNCKYWVQADFARTLEVSRKTARAENARLREKVEECQMALKLCRVRAQLMQEICAAAMKEVE